MRLLNILSVLILIINSCGANKITVKETKCVSHYDTVLQKEVFSFVDEMPQYPEGSNELLKFVAENLEYPEQEEYQGTINYSFIVDVDGSLLDKKIYNKKEADYSLLDKKALEVLDKMPKWKVGRCEGKEVPVRIILPIKL